MWHRSRSQVQVRHWRGSWWEETQRCSLDKGTFGGLMLPDATSLDTYIEMKFICCSWNTSLGSYFRKCYSWDFSLCTKWKNITALFTFCHWMEHFWVGLCPPRSYEMRSWWFPRPDVNSADFGNRAAPPWNCLRSLVLALSHYKAKINRK